MGSRLKTFSLILLTLAGLVLLSSIADIIWCYDQTAKTVSMIRTKEAEIKSERTNKAQLDQLRAEIVKLDSFEQPWAAFTPNQEGQAEFGRDLTELARQSQVKIDHCSMQTQAKVLPNWPQFRVFQWNIRLTGSYQGLVRFLELLARQKHCLKVAGLHLTALPSPSAKSNEASYLLCSELILDLIVSAPPAAPGPFPVVSKPITDVENQSPPTLTEIAQQPIVRDPFLASELVTAVKVIPKIKPNVSPKTSSMETVKPVTASPQTAKPSKMVEVGPKATLGKPTEQLKIAVEEDKGKVSLKGLEKVAAIASPTPPKTVEPVMGLTTTYVTKDKDCIKAIANKFGVPGQTIFAANNIASSVAKLPEGKTLTIPIPLDHVYYLKAKETIWRLAMRYGTTVELLVEINKITDLNKLEVGQTIILPVSAKKIVNKKYLVQ